MLTASPPDIRGGRPSVAAEWYSRTYTNAAGEVYVGEFVDGYRRGVGTIRGETYEGDVDEGLSRALSVTVITWPSGETYEGEVDEGRAYGFGTLMSSDSLSTYKPLYVQGILA
ncbi:hypothetical protein T484DRAFT_1818801 [Baffinella frigidus]|nr:hypothetical protein T484DRAFT_1818801 [Cryptophyta sp. CCMP2293]